MIQRIQTIWLLLACIAVLALFLFPYAVFSDSQGLAQALKVTGVVSHVNGANQTSTSFLFILQIIATVVLAMIPLVVIFNYKNRKKQIRLLLINILLAIIFGIWLYLTSQSSILANGNAVMAQNMGIGALLIPVYIIFLLLAIKGIRSDNKLVRSADRLR